MRTSTPRIAKILVLVLVVAIFCLAGLAQAPTPKDVWQPFKVFLGSWKGQGSGEPGTGDYERSYRFIFNERFIEVKNRSSWRPTAQNPPGEIHEDLGYISYDKARKTFVLRQFHIEGFVNQYRLESISEDGRRIVFVSEAIENIAPGWRAKETYQIAGRDEFTETFELAPPGQEFAAYSTATLKHVK